MYVYVRVRVVLLELEVGRIMSGNSPIAILCRLLAGRRNGSTVRARAVLVKRIFAWGASIPSCDMDSHVGVNKVLL